MYTATFMSLRLSVITVVWFQPIWWESIRIWILCVKENLRIFWKYLRVILVWRIFWGSSLIITKDQFMNILMIKPKFFFQFKINCYGDYSHSYKTAEHTGTEVSHFSKTSIRTKSTYFFKVATLMAVICDLFFLFTGHLLRTNFLPIEIRFLKDKRYLSILKLKRLLLT